MVRFFLFLIGLTSSILAFNQYGPKNYFAIPGGTSNIEAVDLNQDSNLDFIFGGNKQVRMTYSLNEGNEVYEYIDILIGEADLPISFMEWDDLDNDGDKDVVVVWDGYVGWYENIGAGELGSYNSIHDIGDEVTDVMVVDLDGNGYKDILLGVYYMDDIRWYPNSGGSFTSFPVISSFFDQPSDVNAADIDSDGDLDVLAASGLVTYDLVWWENLGGGMFSTMQSIPAIGINIWYVDAADFTGDGMDDLVAVHYGGAIDLYENLGGGLFGTGINLTSVYDEPKAVDHGDFDGDGDLDLICTAFEKPVGYFENLSPGVFAPPILILPGTSSVSQLDIVDMDGDMDIDILTNVYNHLGNIWLENDGTGSFIQRTGIWPSEGYLPKDIITEDMDQDGDKDVLSTSFGADLTALYENLGDNNFAPQENIDTTVIDPVTVRTGDLDLDGDPDVITVSSEDSLIVWYENLGNLNFGPPQIIMSGLYRPVTLEVADIDEDSDFDLIWTHYGTPGRVLLSENNGGTFLLPVIVTSCSGFGEDAIILEDIDEDTDIDLVFICSADVTAKLNDGVGNFGTNILLSPEWTFNELLYEDFDGDFKMDIIGQSTSSGTFWLRNLGGGNFDDAYVLYPTPSASYDFDMIDFDQDGDNDFVYHDDGTWTLKLRENLGGGFFGPAISFDPTPFAQNVHLEVEDLNGDGIEEILCTAASPWQAICFYENQDILDALVTGMVFVDVNQNGAFDSTDTGISMASILATPSSDFTFTNSQGEYYLNFTDSLGVYAISPSNILPYWTLSTDSSQYLISINSGSTQMDSLNFGFMPDTVVNVFEVNLIGDHPTCGQLRNFWATCKNVGTSIPSGFVKLSIDSNIQFVSSLYSPDSIVGQDLYWAIDSLFYFSEILEHIYVQMPNFSTIDDSLVSILQICVTDDFGNIIYSESDTLIQLLTCSYDPNDKLSTPAGVDSLGYVPVSTTSLEYTIRFQNTGTDTAFTVIIKDQLDSNLIWESIVPLAYSHQSEIFVDQNGQMTITFNNILLPDSNTNELQSHGFVKFRIDLVSGLPAGTSIYNTAGIFFDNNPAIVTNTVINTLFDCNYLLESFSAEMALCEGDVLDASFSECPTGVNVLWSIDSVASGSGPTFSWISDSGGLHDLEIILSTSFCSLDTNYTVNVHPEIPLQPDTLKICSGESVVIFGDNQTSAGFYSDTLVSVDGCDSIVGVQLEIMPLPVVNINPLSGNTICEYTVPVTLVGVPSGGVFSGPGITGDTFYPIVSGDGHHDIFYTYADTNGCVSTDVIDIPVYQCNGLDENDSLAILVYPNPFSDHTFIYLGANHPDKYSIQIYDIVGQLVYTNSNLTGSSFRIDRGDLADGVYTLILKTQEVRAYTFKIALE